MTASDKKPAPLWAWIVGVGLLVLFIIMLVAGQSPASKEKARARDAIALCWQEQARKSLTPAAARFAAGACERMEAEFTQKYQAAP